MRILLASLFIVTPALVFACEAHKPLASVSKPLAAIYDKEQKKDRLSKNETKLLREGEVDEKRLRSLRAMTEPVCVEHDKRGQCGDEGKADCETLSPDEVDAASYLEDHRRYTLSAEERKILSDQIEAMTKKWSSR